MCLSFLSGEIDVVEAVGHEPRVAHCGCHTAAQNHARGNQRARARVDVADAHDAYRVYAVERDRTGLRFYVDDALVLDVARPSAARGEADGPAHWPFDERFFLLINVAVGGSWGGERGIDDARAFPATLEVSHVRVYQRVAPRDAWPR